MYRFALALTAAAALWIPAAGAAPAAEPSAPTQPSIAAVAGKTPQLSTLLTLVKKAGLAKTLSSPGALTVLAPTNAAFAKVPKATLRALERNPAQLRRVLLYHVLPAKVPAAKVVQLRSAKTVAGPTVRIRVVGETVRVNTARVLATDIKASNGIVHLIDRVLIPPAS